MLSFDDVWLSDRRGPIFKALSFHVSAGDRVAFASGNGSTRDAAASLSLCELRPNSGCVRTLGRDTSALSRAERTALRRRIGLARADVPLVAEWSVEENFRLVLKLRGLPPERSLREARRAAGRLGIAGAAYRSSRDLSDEQCVLAEIARATLGPPPLVLIAHPLDVLGENEREIAHELLAEAAAWGAAVVLTRVGRFARWDARPIWLGAGGAAGGIRSLAGVSHPSTPGRIQDGASARRRPGTGRELVESSTG